MLLDDPPASTTPLACQGAIARSRLSNSISISPHTCRFHGFYFLMRHFTGPLLRAKFGAARTRHWRNGKVGA